MCKESLAHSLLLVYEFAQLRFADQASVRKKIIKVDGAELLSKAWQQEQGVLLLTPPLVAGRFWAPTLAKVTDFSAV